MVLVFPQNVRDILAIQSNGVYLLGGHSFGGILAVENAYALEAMGRNVGMVSVPIWCLNI